MLKYLELKKFRVFLCAFFYNPTRLNIAKKFENICDK
jgi:hypothetical protein